MSQTTFCEESYPSMPHSQRGLAPRIFEALFAAKEREEQVGGVGPFLSRLACSYAGYLRFLLLSFLLGCVQSIPIVHFDMNCYALCMKSIPICYLLFADSFDLLLCAAVGRPHLPLQVSMLEAIYNCSRNLIQSCQSNSG